MLRAASSPGNGNMHFVAYYNHDKAHTGCIQPPVGTDSALPGAPDEIVTSYAKLAAAIRQAVDATFADPFVYGPKLPETGVDRIVAGTIDRVMGCANSKEAA